MISIVLVGTMLVFSFGSEPPGQSIYKHIDKLEHFALYAAATFVLLLFLVWRPGRGDGPFPSAALMVVGGAIFVGVGVEILQGLWANRDAETMDAVASGAGAVAGYVCWFAVRRMRG